MMMNASSITSILPYLKDAWTMSWVGSGLVTIFVPLIIWSSHRARYFKYVGQALKYEDDQEAAQWYYEQQQNQQNNNYGYGNNNGNNNGNNYSYYKDCSWINFSCRYKQYTYAMSSQGGDGDRVRQYLPSWYVFFGKESEEMERWREENGNEQEGQRDAGRNNANSVNGGLTFAYILTLVLFLALLSYGAITFGKKEPVTTLTVFLVVALVVGLMNVFMSISAIPTDDRDMEDSYYGWYGQTSVLLVYTNFWMMLFSFAFLVAFQVKNFLAKRDAQGIETLEDGTNTTSNTAGTSNTPVTDYKAPSEVQMA